MNATIAVQGREKRYSFSAVIHQHQSPEAFFLDPNDFYLRWGKAIPQGLHHEIEITEPSGDVLRAKVIHVHASAKCAGLLICYPLHIPTLQKALAVLKTWALGTVLKWETGIDLNTVRDGECGGDDDLFEQVLLNRHSIKFGELITTVPQ